MPHHLATPTVAVVGSGAVGLCAAMHLRSRSWTAANGGATPPPMPRVLLVDPDAPRLPATRASSLRSAASCRMQFSVPENVRMSLFSTKFIQNPREFGYARRAPSDSEGGAAPWWRPGAYVFTAATPEGAARLRANVDMQRAEGAYVDLVAAHERTPFLRADDLLAVTLGSPHQEGSIDAHMWCAALHAECAARGVEFVNGKVTHVETSDSAVRGLTVQGPSGDVRIACSAVVAATGAWSGRLAKSLGLYLPVSARRRVVYVFRCPGLASRTAEERADPARNALVVDVSGAYFRREAFPDTFLGGLSPTAEEDVEFDPDDTDSAFNTGTQQDAAFFEERLWPLLAHRAPAMSELKLVSSWAGWYDWNEFDENLLIGAFPALPNLIWCTGSSGHGLQHAPAQGRAIAELVREGSFTTLDLSRFAVDRKVRVVEDNIV